MNDDKPSEPPERLVARLRAVQQMVQSDLAAAVAVYDLTRSQLLGVEANARRQARAGVAVTASDFWTQTAEPQAAVLLSACRSIQDDGRLTIVESIRGLLPAEPDRLADDAGRRRDGPWGRAMVDEIRRMGPTFVPPSAIDELGDWWQRRLRRRAALAAVPRSLIVPMSRLSSVVARCEVELSARSPWSHGDRLLTAFELVHAELRNNAAVIQHELVHRIDAMVAAADPLALFDPSVMAPRQVDGDGRRKGDDDSIMIDLP